MVTSASLITQAVYQVAPVPDYTFGMVRVFTGVVRFQQYWTLEKTGEQDWSTILSTFGYVLVSQNELAKSLVKMLCICVVVQDLIQHHLAFSNACGDLWNAVLGTYSTPTKKPWNVDPFGNRFTYLSPSLRLSLVESAQGFKEYLKKIVLCIIEVVKKLYWLSSCYVLAYDITAFNDPLTQYFAIKRLALDPGKPIRQLIANEVVAKQILERRKDLVNRILENAGFESRVDDLKTQINKAIHYQKTVESIVEKGSLVVEVAKDILGPTDKLLDPIGAIQDGINDPDEYDKCVKLGLIEDKKRLELRSFPYWTGQPLANAQTKDKWT